MTNVVDNVYDVFAKDGRFGEITVETSSIPSFGKAFHVETSSGVDSPPD